MAKQRTKWSVYFLIYEKLMMNRICINKYIICIGWCLTTHRLQGIRNYSVYINIKYIMISIYIFEAQQTVNWDLTTDQRLSIRNYSVYIICIIFYYFYDYIVYYNIKYMWIPKNVD